MDFRMEGALRSRSAEERARGVVDERERPGLCDGSCLWGLLLLRCGVLGFGCWMGCCAMCAPAYLNLLASVLCVFFAFVVGCCSPHSAMPHTRRRWSRCRHLRLRLCLRLAPRKGHLRAPCKQPSRWQSLRRRASRNPRTGGCPPWLRCREKRRRRDRPAIRPPMQVAADRRRRAGALQERQLVPWHRGRRRRRGRLVHRHTEGHLHHRLGRRRALWRGGGRFVRLLGGSLTGRILPALGRARLSRALSPSELRCVCAS